MIGILDAETTVTGPLAAVLRKSTLDQMAKTVMAEMAEEHAVKKVRKHFTRSGAIEYGYAKRTDKYLRRKAWKKGHRNPLVWSGDTKKRILSAAGARVSSTAKTATLTFRPPAHLFKQAHAKSPDMARELSTISSREVRASALFFEKRMAAKLNAYSRILKVT